MKFSYLTRTSSPSTIPIDIDGAPASRSAWSGTQRGLLPPLASLDLGQRILMMAAGALVMACVGGLILSVMAAL